MKNNSNIYDIDGTLIRAIDDTHKWTVQEAQEKIQYYNKKIEELGGNSKNAQIYKIYIRNLNKYIFDLYIKMPKEQFEEELSRYSKQENLQEQINKAMEELKNDVEKEENDGKTGENIENAIPGSVTGDNEGDTNGESRDVEVGERELSDIHEERSTSQDDLLVERDNVNVINDEYVNFEEV